MTRHFRRARALGFRVLVITDDDSCRSRGRGVVETVARALLPRAEGAAVLVRAKARSHDDVAELTGAVASIARRASARVLVHTHADLVRYLKLDGAHLDGAADAAGWRAVLPPGALLGASRHAGDALGDDVDYATMSPVFAPYSKPGDKRRALGVAGLRAKVREAAAPLVALGGVDDVRARGCVHAGAHAVAVVGAVMAAHDPRRALVALLDATARG